MPGRSHQLDEAGMIVQNNCKPALVSAEHLGLFCYVKPAKRLVHCTAPMVITLTGNGPDSCLG